MTTPDVTLRIDATGTAFGTTPTYTNYTSSLRAGGVSITWGSSDEQSEPSPRTCSFELANANGAWTPGNAAAPAGWDIGAPVNVRVTVSAVVYDRFTGFVDSIEPTWPGGTQSWSVVKVTCTDVTARLALANPLRSMVVQEMLEDSPTYLYPLDEPAGSTSAGDIGVNRNAAATPVLSAGGSGRGVTFGNEMNLPDPTTGARVGQPDATGHTALSLPNVVPTSGGFSLGYVFTTQTTPPAALSVNVLNQIERITTSTAPYILVTLNGTGTFSALLSDTSDSGGVTTGQSITLTQFSSSLCDGLPHTLHVTLSSDRMTGKLYIDGVLEDTVTAAAPLAFAGLNRNHLGGVVGGDPTDLQFPGVIGKVALFPSTLSAARVLAHHQAAMGTLTERSDVRFARLAGYANLTTSGLPTGHATMGHQNLSDKNITEALATVARTEGSVAFTTGAGALTFQSRVARYNTATGLTLTTDNLTSDFGTRRDRQGLANEVTVTREGGSSQRFVDSTSQTAIGRFDGGSFEVAPSTDYDALQNAAWQVARRKRYATRIPAVKVNLLAANDATRTAVLGATISTLVSITGLPANAPATSALLFIEGGSEVLGLSEWGIEFFTSPVMTAAAGARVKTLRADAAASDYTRLDGGVLVPF